MAVAPSIQPLTIVCPLGVITTVELEHNSTKPCVAALTGRTFLTLLDPWKRFMDCPDADASPEPFARGVDLDG